jgi:hypothetical protein
MVGAYLAWRTRWRNNGKPARPNIIRLSILTLLTEPATCPFEYAYDKEAAIVNANFKMAHPDFW